MSKHRNIIIIIYIKERYDQKHVMSSKKSFKTKPICILFYKLHCHTISCNIKNILLISKKSNDVSMQSINSFNRFCTSFDSALVSLSLLYKDEAKIPHIQPIHFWTTWRRNHQRVFVLKSPLKIQWEFSMIYNLYNVLC